MHDSAIIRKIGSIQFQIHGLTQNPKNVLDYQRILAFDVAIFQKREDPVDNFKV